MKTPDTATDNNVGSKTPEEIKKDAETCMKHPHTYSCNSCQLYSECHGIAEYIIKELYDLVLCYESRLAKAERERDSLHHCNCGDTVYKLITTKDGSTSVAEAQACGFHFINPPKQRSNKRGSYLIVYHESSGTISHLPVDQIGKTVFFTYEDAKNASDKRRGVFQRNTKEE